jgi:hypothetical protein
VCLREKLERSNTDINFEKSSVTLDEILIFQRSPFDRTGLGYREKKEISKEDPTSSKQVSERKTKSYVDVLKTPIKVEDNKSEKKCSTKDKSSSQGHYQEYFSIKMESYNQV